MAERRRELLERIPPAFWERYFAIFEEPEPETIHPDVYQRLIDEGTDRILEYLKQHAEERRKVAEKCLKEAGIRVQQAAIDEKLARSRLVASDASNRGADFRSAFAPLYAAAALAAEGWEIIDGPITEAGKPALWPKEPNPRDRESLLASKLLFDVTAEAIERWRPRYVVVDGSLVLNPRFRMIRASEGFKEDYKETVSSAVRLIRRCYELGVPIVGFIKRTRMRRITRSIGCENMRDTSPMDLILSRVGQYIEPRIMADEETGRLPLTVRDYQAEARELGLGDEFVEEGLAFYYSYLRTGPVTPFRLELPKYALKDLPTIASILVTTSDPRGMPYAIHEVDSITKVSSVVSNIRTLVLFSKALDLVLKGELKPEDLALITLQHGEVWALSREHLLMGQEER